MDARDRAAMTGRWYESFDQDRMTVEVLLYNEDADDDADEEFLAEFPVEFEVCTLCNGKGSHVNPGIDAHGISADEFYDDPGFAEDYFSGMYDVSCYECKGLRVIPEIAEKRLTDEQKKNYGILQDKLRDDAMYAAECAAERRMGC
jgi:hypothetical protein